MDKCSIIMPTYNAAPYIAEAINSCLNQTYTNLELVIVDDGSTDSSRKVIQHYINKDKRVKYFFKLNGGPASALNYGIKKSTGDIICFVAADDVQLPNHLEVVVEALKHAEFCYTGYYHANIYAQPWEEVKPKPLTKENIKKNICMSGGAVAGKRHIFEKVKFREDLRTNEDMALAWDLYKLKVKYAIVDIPTFNYRLLTTGLSYARKKEVERITKQLQEEIDEYKD